ncbi:MAG: metalloregulator ArsR/SmtB family transcription factor [Rhizobiaceae bacterium]|jgi:DNA-binding transcriptional ArsR family regulator|nr:metalloregulator ArsR/SmtB family transcription factor [Rhizobiaceae bacterium]
MDESSASFAFAALSQPHRLEALRLLVKAGPDGMAAGDIADALGARQNTMSANLAVLLRAGLVTNMREGRIIRYRADMERMRALISFLIMDCCGGRPEHCAPLHDLLNPLPVSQPNLCDC